LGPGHGRILPRRCYHFYIFRATLFFIFAESTTGVFFLAEASAVVVGLEFIIDESRATVLMSLLHFILPRFSHLRGLLLRCCRKVIIIYFGYGERGRVYGIIFGIDIMIGRV